MTFADPGSMQQARNSRRRRRALVLFAVLATTALDPAVATPPPFEDTIAQRAQACTGCHGPQGRAAPDGYYPRIAGKPPVYLYNQLLNFRDGRRRYGLMNDLLAPLTDVYLREIADHFAALEVAYPPPQPPKEDAATIERGRVLVTQGEPARRVPACVQCHGTAMMGVVPSIPGLLGMPRDYLNAQLGAWRNGARRAQAPDCMAQVAKALSPEDIGAVSAWLATQPALGKPAPALDAPLPLACGGVDPSALGAKGRP
jgi:cytochrome c553